mgnify:CR=1 FL=1
MLGIIWIAVIVAIIRIITGEFPIAEIGNEVVGGSVGRTIGDNGQSGSVSKRMRFCIFGVKEVGLSFTVSGNDVVVHPLEWKARGSTGEARGCEGFNGCVGWLRGDVGGVSSIVGNCVALVLVAKTTWFPRRIARDFKNVIHVFISRVPGKYFTT